MNQNQFLPFSKEEVKSREGLRRHTYMTKRLKRYRWIVLLPAIAAIGSLFLPLPEKDFQKESVHSLRVVDRNGILLREYLNDLQGRGQWKALAEFSPALLTATISVEDRRFRYHPGIDPLAILRALIDNIRAGKAKSGGSTITQQVIRNIYHHPRTLPSKTLEAWYALRLERMMSKNEILEQYLNRVPFGNQLIGAEAASRFYFDKPARDLSLAEAAFLAGLPNAPSFLNPYSNPELARKRQQHILQAMARQGRISPEEYSRAAQQQIVLVPPDVNFRAPHLVEMAATEAGQFPGTAVVHTTIDYPLQRSIEWLLKGHLKHLKSKNVTNAAAVVIDNKTMRVLALVGSADYFNNAIQGQVNGALARRQPGSSVKPFTYGLAFEGPFTPADLIPDIPTQIPDEEGDYVPENYDRRYHGPVRVRTALACSYNVPAVRVLRRVGRENLLQRMIRAGLTTLDQPSIFYGYGLTLGNGEVTLFQLTRAYASFANRGMWQPTAYIESLETTEGLFTTTPTEPMHRLFSDQVAYLVTDILKDPDARRPAFGHAFPFPFECAVKTGTTKDYRDNWTVGYTTEYTVGVWAGNFDGAPMKGVSGITGAGQIFQDIMMVLHVRGDRDLPPPFGIPEGLRSETVCATSGKLPNPHCRKTIREWFVKEKLPSERCDVHRVFRYTNKAGESVAATFEVFPEEYREWTEEQRLASPPPDAKPLAAVEIPGRADFALFAPQNGQIFKIDPILRREYQSIKILGNVPPDVSDVRVRVNNRKEISYDAEGAWWQLQKGEHRFQLQGIRRGKIVRSASVSIAVQ